LQPPSLRFLQEYLSFGFLFQRDGFSDPPREIPAVAVVGLTLFAALCVASALSYCGRALTWPSRTEGLHARRLLPTAMGSALIVLMLASLAVRRQQEMALTGLVPIAALAMPSVLNRVWPLVRWGPARLGERLPVSPGSLSLFFMLAFVPSLFVFSVSFAQPLLASRLFLLFTPYLLVVIAVGAVRLARPRLVGIALAIVLLIVHLASVVYFREHPSEAIDYQDLAWKIRDRSDPSDLIFVHHKNWAATPMSTISMSESTV
jgi:hypothetical protein